MKNIDEMEVEGKRVIVRCDFNVPIDKEGRIKDDVRIKKSIPTINYLSEKGAKVILISHFGNPKEKWSMKESENPSFLKNIFKRKTRKESIYPVVEHLSDVLQKPVLFSNNCIGKETKARILAMNKGEIILLENLRFYKEEEENSKDFAGSLASMADVYINDAFSVSHRRHASVCELPRLLPSAAGILLQSEVNSLQRIKKGIKRPFVAIIGGAKVESKIAVADYFMKNADHLLIGGKIANMVLIVRKILVGFPWPEEDIVRIIEEMDFTSSKVHLPVDVIVSPDHKGSTYIRETGPGQTRKDEEIFDIGSETVRMFGEIIKEAKTIIWAGPLGFFEEKKFESGTRGIAELISRNHKALKVVGGGDTINALFGFGLLDKMDHVSCGGGAMLSYISGSPMPGLEML